MQCPQCEHENPPQAKFCLECGARFSVKCPNCGAELPASAKYCLECGQSVGEAERRHPTPEPRSYTPKHLAKKILTSRSALEGERKQVTVLFADVKGSMELAEQVDPEEWHRIMDRFFAILSEGVHRFEGTINQYTGDGIMALFGAPIAHEDHAQRACYAALHLGDELRCYSQDLKKEKGLGFSVRMGINSGEVVVGKIGDDLRMDYTAQGQTVGLAARMQELASPDTVYLTDETASLVSGYINLDDLGAFKIKGARQPVPVFQLKGMGPLRSRFDVARARGLTRFVGREDDMQALESALARCREGNGQVVGVVGEAGVGKSRLCFEFLQRCRAGGIQVLESRGVAHGKSIPLLPVLQIFRAYFGITEQDDDRVAREKIAGRLLLLDEGFREVLPLLFEFLGVADREHDPQQIDPEGRQRQLFGVLRRLVHSGRRESPTATLIEDLHWIDGGTEAWLAEWVDAIAGSSGLLLVNFRPEYHADWMQKSYYRQLPLAPLGAQAIRQLLDDLLGGDPSIRGLAEAIHQRTGGNPFFTEEVVQSLIESGHLEGNRGSYRLVTPVEELAIPSTVQSMLAARIDRLSEREKQVLQTAAVIGKEFSEPVLAAVIEMSKGDLGASLSVLKGAEFIYEEALYPEAEYAFKHPLTQEVAYHSQLSERRARIHAAVARAAEQLRADKVEEQAALLAHHWEEAGEPLEAARWRQRAAEWAGFSDPTEALRHWRAVRSLATAAGESEDTARLALAACVWILGFGWRMRISGDEASAVFNEGRRLAEQSGDLHSLARLCSSYGWSKTWAIEPAEEAFSLVDEAARLARRIADPVLTLRMAGEWAMTYHHFGRPRQALRIVEEAVEGVRDDPKVGSEIVRLRAYSTILCAKAFALQDLGQLQEAARAREQARRLAQEHRSEEVLFWAVEGLTLSALAAGDPEGALRHARDAAEIAERIGGLHSLEMSCLRLAQAYLACGHWHAAREAFERTTQIGRETVGHARRLLCLAEIDLGTGDYAQALVAIEKTLSLVQGRDREVEVDALVGLARVLRCSEGLEAVHRIEKALSEAWSISEEAEARGWQPQILLERAELARLKGEDATRERELREAHRLFTDMGATGHAERLAKELCDRKQ